MVQKVKDFAYNTLRLERPAEESEVKDNVFQDVTNLSDKQRKFLEERNQALQKIREENLQGEELKKRLDAINKLATAQGVAGMNFVDNSSDTVYQSANNFMSEYAPATDNLDRDANK